MTEQEARKLEVPIEWNGKANVCTYCGRVPETFYVVTGHDHTDDSIRWCICREGTQYKSEIESLRQRLAECQATNLQMRGLVDQFLVENDTTEFGCACHPGEGYTCGTCRTFDRQLPLRQAIALPNDATALNELIAERTADKETEVKHLLGKLTLANNAIAELTAEVEKLKDCWSAEGAQADTLRQKNAELTAQLVQQSVDAANEFNTHHESMLKEVDKITAQRDAAMKDAERLRVVFGSMRNLRVDQITLEMIDAAIANGKEQK